MTTLEYNPEKALWYARDMPPAIATELAMDWSKPARVYMTDDIYTALALWDVASPAARDAMFLERLEIEASWEKEYHGLRQFRIPPEQNLYPFQQAGVSYALDRRNTLIGDQPGLGKTPMAIAVANELDAERVLVVCPASVRLQWRDMFFKWAWPRNKNTATGVPNCNVVLSSRDGIARKRPSWTIISYDLIVRSAAIYEALLTQDFDLIIFDEIHYLKSVEARRTQVLFGSGNWEGVANNSKRLLGLTGTPLPSRPREAYTVARAFDFNSIGGVSEDKFKSLYNPSFRASNGFMVEKTARTPILQNRLRANFMVRRMKRDVLTQLPEVRYELAYIVPNRGVRKALKAESLLGIDPLQFDKSDAELQGQIATQRREMGEAKVPLVEEHARRMFDGGLDKLVIFTWHKTVLKMLEERLEEYGVVTVPGGTSATQKHIRKLRFIKDPGTRIFIGNILACGTGTDGLQEVCSMAMFAEASWTPGENEQSVDRLWRMGQQGTVLAQFLVAPESMDERVLTSAINKADTVHSALDGKLI